MWANSGSGQTINFSWRSRLAPGETYPYSITYPPGNVGPGRADNGLFSDVLTISGMELTPGSDQTDPYVLQMSYSPNAYTGTLHLTDPYNANSPVVVNSPYNPITGYPESQLVTDQEIALWWLDPNGFGNGHPGWSPSVNGNHGIGLSAINNYHDSYNSLTAGSFASFQAQYGVTTGNLGNFLGSSGVDTADHVVWAVLNHNSSFAVAPEPSSIVMAGMTLAFGSLLAWRRRKQK